MTRLIRKMRPAHRAARLPAQAELATPVRERVTREEIARLFHAELSARPFDRAA